MSAPLIKLSTAVKLGLLPISRATAQRYINDGRLKAARMGRDYYIERAVCDNFMQLYAVRRKDADVQLEPVQPQE
ncbi:helix-turn-helix domain-containing protein [Xanthobacter versatilis]|uniref:helix-turn-helix domain-containing protein n=1 Tax=Xanthobacter autotrophicus (strain ATCC BAA-1158 / Py2) TaxID=78245 RepID=UPI00372C810A